MILITSAAYVDQDFVTEIGLIPPSFLPVQNRRLYELQIEMLQEQDLNDDIYLSIPESFKINNYDDIKLKKLGIRIIRVPDGISLGESVLYCWNSSAKYHEHFRILHGDTLFIDMKLSHNDEISTHPNKGFYKRASVSMITSIIHSHDLKHPDNEWANDENSVLSGYFSFNHPLAFIKSLIENKMDFVSSIKTYHNKYPMNLNASGKWLDLGHLNSFFNSRTYLTTQRAFNDLTMSSRIVLKKSTTKGKKIYAEGNWFNTIPSDMRLYTPQLLSHKKGAHNYDGSEYSLEYLYLLPLSDLFVFGSLPLSSWKNILTSLREVLSGLHQYTSDECALSSLDKLYLHKTLERLEEHTNLTGINFFDKKFSYLEEHDSLTLFELARKSAEFINKAKKSDVSIVHGDFCFSNLLFDSRVSAIKCIDPRGIDAQGNLTIYGDRRYDLAKLYHSIVGYYDLIISGHYELTENQDKINIKFHLDENYQKSLEREFNEFILSGLDYSEKEIIAITLHLFLSMLPLHSDRPDRQRAFIANAFRLYKKLIGE
ncbi:aminoglycoside phosphotransferase family protein [Citrobacter freundii]|uniref:aminoglycoside phosphotransferase family protein n=1 Tax=Citrobacter freundii TaxID=546 RepID=UPI00200C0BB8|nr:aminoglycoside phosphotransferase family protein [Citrobacter freundii]UQI36679.1 aminoglycoside phosphotransferase family protein [Citrobacter freundii]